MVDTASGVPVVTILRLSGGAAVASRATPPRSPLSRGRWTCRGSCSTCRGRAWTEVIADDLGRATGTVLDTQLIAGSGASGQLRGLATVTGILTVTTSPTTAQAQLSAISVSEERVDRDAARRDGVFAAMLRAVGVADRRVDVAAGGGEAYLAVEGVQCRLLVAWRRRRRDLHRIQRAHRFLLRGQRHRDGAGIGTQRQSGSSLSQRSQTTCMPE